MIGIWIHAASPGLAEPTVEHAVPGFLLILTFVTGMVDTVSYVGLGLTFVAHMTGNVAFIGFGAAGVAGVSVDSALVTFWGFVIGAVCGGRLFRRIGAARHLPLVVAAAVETVFVGAAALLAAGYRDGAAQRGRQHSPSRISRRPS